MSNLQSSDSLKSKTSQATSDNGLIEAEPAPSGVDKSFPEVYNELRKMARTELRRGSKHTLYTTELVHEIYMKICRNDALTFDNAARFYNYAAIVMRHILIDRATRRARVKFGGDLAQTDLDDPDLNRVAQSTALALQLDAALRQLEQEDPRAAKVVELHYFAGLSLERVGQVLGIARRTVVRDWSFARAFLESNAPEGAESAY